MNKFDCLVSEMLCIGQLARSLSAQADSVRAEVFVWLLPLCGLVVTLELAFVDFVFVCALDGGVVGSPRRRDFISFVFSCLYRIIVF